MTKLRQWRSKCFLALLLLSSHRGTSFVMSMSSTLDSSPKSTCSAESGGLVLITGASQGIGRATSILLASRGYHVAIVDVKPAESVVEEIEKLDINDKGKAIPFVADISNEDEVVQLFDRVHAAFGMNPTGLVNNAGIMEKMEKDICKIDFATLQADMAVNAYGPFFCCKEFVRRASINRGGNGGAIVNVSSVSAESGQPLAYAMSKGAQESLMVGLSKSLPPEGIRINTVVPGLTDTPMAPPGQAERLGAWLPMRRAGNPFELAKGIAYFLAEGTYCSGAKLRIAGGL